MLKLFKHRDLKHSHKKSSPETKIHQTGSGQPFPVTSSSNTQFSKLPKLTSPKFDGDYSGSRSGIRLTPLVIATLT
ncbi:hypothetical protein DPMN_160289 [Dreissena polymorpha]|uniref:Uncharacterized protein n=1 Tax=Dreissena polymorpha TaxID=45954 RepID=A0A9D4IRH7_DREPO|nr:hypothetical protein DPMN_160289 [Dreissena polymorpha]